MAFVCAGMRKARIISQKSLAHGKISHKIPIEFDGKMLAMKGKSCFGSPIVSCAVGNKNARGCKYHGTEKAQQHELCGRIVRANGRLRERERERCIGAEKSVFMCNLAHVLSSIDTETFHSITNSPFRLYIMPYKAYIARIPTILQLNWKLFSPLCLVHRRTISLCTRGTGDRIGFCRWMEAETDRVWPWRSEWKRQQCTAWGKTKTHQSKIGSGAIKKYRNK